MTAEQRSDSTPARRVAALVLAALGVAVAARWTFPVPGSDVPQSGQTLAVLLVGFFLGGREGMLALGLYLLAGGLGLPVFADGASGASHLMGPTAGYLIGFVAAAGLIGWLADSGRLMKSGRLGPLPRTVLAMVGAHGVILGLGWIGLARSIGVIDGYRGGVEPFLWGGVWKSVVGAVVAIGWTVARGSRRPLDTMEAS